MAFNVRPQLSLHESLLMVFPLGSWDRKEFLAVCDELDVKILEIRDHLNQASYKFGTLKDYKMVLNFIYGPDSDKRWNK